MPSTSNLLNAALTLRSVTSNTPETVIFTSPSSGEQLIGDFAGPTYSITIPSINPSSSLLPATVFGGSADAVSFVIIKSSTFESGLAQCLRSTYGTEIVFGYAIDDLAIGLYLASIDGDEVTFGCIYRVHYDDHMAFMNGLLPNGTNGAYRYTPANTISDSTVDIPVPSRLYTNGSKTADQPLKGFRVTVKDIIDIKGVKTSQGNRAWFKLYDAKNVSAPGIQRLVDLGAVTIGKTKTAQFANSDRPTADWVDYHDAFNARGDGYQDPGVSSAGAGAATGAYKWVDVSIATDTGGSIRIPAGKNGVFGIRPSFGVVSNEGVLLEGPDFDSVGYHTRSPYTLQEFGKAWFADQTQLVNNHTSFPKRIIVPRNLWPVANNASQAIFTEWIGKLSTFLNATVETTSIGEFWNATANKPDTVFASYMQFVGFNLIWKNQLDNVITPFRKAYAAAFGGRTPFINPFPAARYQSAEIITDKDVSIAYEKFSFFKDWFGKQVVKSDPDSCSESLFLIPMATGDVSYRNTVYSPVNVSTWATFTPYYYSVQSQGPEVVFPIGEVPYQSNITNVEEKLPVAIDLLAHRHCDLMLLDLSAALADAGLLKEVKTGSTLW